MHPCGLSQDSCHGDGNGAILVFIENGHGHGQGYHKFHFGSALLQASLHSTALCEYPKIKQHFQTHNRHGWIEGLLIGGWTLEAGRWRLDVGGWTLEAGRGRPDVA